MLLAFGPFELDLAACELRRDGRSVGLQPRVFDTLRYLVEHRDRLVSKQELIAALWGGQQLNAIAVPWSISHARKALGERAGGGRYIETVRGRGYRFVAEVHELGTPNLPLEAAAPPAQVHRTSDPFVGREPEMLQLTAALDAGRTRGSFYLLAGEPGIGKTRCAQELASLARGRSIVVWSGRCLDSAATPPFWPFIQVLRDAVSDPSLSDVERSEARELLVQLMPNARTPSPDATPASDDARFWLLDRLSRFLARAAKDHVRMLTLDDLHCADENSLRALALLSPLLADTHLFVIGTARDAPSDPERSAGYLALRLRPCERVVLGALQVGDVARYLAATLGEQPADELSEAVHARTAGNPLFVREAVRLVCAEHERGGSMRARDVRLPEAAKGFLNDRLTSLPQLARDALDAACVIGDEFELPLLQRVTGIAAEQSLSSLQAAESVRIVEPRVGGQKHGFAHPLLREVLYAALTASRRSELHARVGLALESLAWIEPRVSELAYHFHHASGDEHHDRAARYGRLAGDAAMHVFAYDEAVQFYAWALEAQPYRRQPDTRAGCELLLASADALLRAGRLEEWRTQCKQAIALAREAGHADLLVQAARQLRPSVTSAVVPDELAVTALEDALARLPEDAIEARALAHSRLASIPPHASKLERSRQLSDEAMRLARRSNDRHVLLEALRSRFRALSGPDSIDELLQVTDEILAIDPNSSSWWSSDALVVRYQTHLRRGDIPAAERALSMFGQMAREMRVREWIWHHDRMVAQRAMLAGDLDEAERRFRELWIESQRLNLPYGAMLYVAQLDAISLERTGRRLASGAPDAGSDPWKWAQEIPIYHCERVLVALQYGEVETARRTFLALSEARFAAVTRDSNFLFASVRLALAAIQLKERAAAEELYEILCPYANLLAVSDFTFSNGSIAHYLGQLARFLELRTRAREHLALASDVNARTGHTLRSIRSRLALAELLAESRSRSERSEALALASSVRASAQRYGLHQVRAAAVVIAERLSATHPTKQARGLLTRVPSTGSDAPKKRARSR